MLADEKPVAWNQRCGFKAKPIVPLYTRPAPAAPQPCWCHKCNEGRLVNGVPFAMTQMIVCPICGNKRCPHASDHALACTASNDPIAAPAAPTSEPARHLSVSLEPTGWKEAAIAWEVCASIHRSFAKGKDALFKTRQADFVRHADDARKMLAAAPAAPKAERPPTCLWSRADDDTDMWETTCGKAFTIIDGSPADNQMAFCCYCGRELESETGDSDADQ